MKIDLHGIMELSFHFPTGMNIVPMAVRILDSCSGEDFFHRIAAITAPMYLLMQQISLLWMHGFRSTKNSTEVHL